MTLYSLFKSTTFTIAGFGAAPAIAESAPPTPAVQETVIAPVITASPGTVETPAASGTPGAKATYSPLGTATIVAALGAVGVVFGMRRKA